MTRITISLPVDVAARLDAEVRATDRTVSAIVRRALRAALPDENDLSPSATAAVTHTPPSPEPLRLGAAAMPGMPVPSGTTGGAGGPSASTTAPAGRLFSKRSGMTDLHRDVLERQAELARQRAAEEQRLRDECARRNIEYLERLDNGDETQ